MVKIQRLVSAADDFWARLEQLLAWEEVSDETIARTVRAILADVRARGDQAVLDYTQRFDRVSAPTLAALEITHPRMQDALTTLPAAQRAALETAAERIRSYHAHQKMESWCYTEADGTLLGQQVTALDRVGLYVPGGNAAYPSSVLMTAIAAKVADVPEVVMVVPPPGGEVNELVLAAAAIANSFT